LAMDARMKAIQHVIQHFAIARALEAPVGDWRALFDRRDVLGSHRKKIGPHGYAGGKVIAVGFAGGRLQRDSTDVGERYRLARSDRQVRNFRLARESLLRSQ